MTEDTAEMERRLEEMGGRLEDFLPADRLSGKLAEAAVIVDAIFGVGFHGEVVSPAREAIELINAALAPVVSADLPSGVAADTGAVTGAAVRAARTVTFSMAKPGHFAEPGCLYTGSLSVEDIGLPRELLPESRTFAVCEGDVRLPPRKEISHKGDYGRLLLVGGSVGYTGAPSLCAKAALRSGAGLVFLGVPEAIYAITAVKNDEAMPFPLPCDEAGRLSADAALPLQSKMAGCDVCAAGPGLGRSDGLTELVGELIRGTDKPLVLDADALFALSRDMEVLKARRGPVILTPHEGEFLRLGGVLSGDRISDARRFAEKHGCILVLKGHRTVTAFPDGEAWINTTGNPGMAKGGSGDVLTGVIGALLGRLLLREAVTTAVWLHGRAGDLCAEKFGRESMLPTDMIEMLPYVTKSMVK